MADSQAPRAAPEILLPPAQGLLELSDQQLAELVEKVESAERQLREQLAPFQRRLQQLADDASPVRTEVRRRDRQRHIQARKQVREQVKEGEAPSLAQLLAAEAPPGFGEPAFTELTFLLDTGGEVALGYPGSRIPSLQMTDGLATSTVSSLGEARELFRQGWDCGVPNRPGVRVHTPGTRLERLLDPERCFVRPNSEVGGGATPPG